MNSEERHVLEGIDENVRQSLISTLAGDGPDLGLMLLELAEEARAAGKTRLANNLFNSALYQEDARGRSGGPVALASLRGLAETAFKLRDYTTASNWATRLSMVAPDDETRDGAMKLIGKARRRIESAKKRRQGQPRQPEIVGGQAITVFEPVLTQLTFADVGGLDAAKNALARVAILPHRYPESAKRFGIAGGGGVLLYGPPGCGKTMISHAAAGEMGVPIITVKASELLHPLYGMAERNLKVAFDTALDNAPCVLFLDELDGIAQPRSTDFFHRSLVNTLLVEIDRLGSGTGVLLIGATNQLERVDVAVRRAGRFSKVVEVGLPDAHSREAIWRQRLADRPCADDVDPVQLVEFSTGLTGADITETVTAASEAVWMQSLEEGIDRDITMADLLIALMQRVPDGAIKNRIGEWLRGDLMDQLDAEED